MIVPGFASRVRRPATNRSRSTTGTKGDSGESLGRYPAVLVAERAQGRPQRRGRVLTARIRPKKRNPSGQRTALRLVRCPSLYKTNREKAKSWTETRRITEREVLPLGGTLMSISSDATCVNSSRE